MDYKSMTKLIESIVNTINEYHASGVASMQLSLKNGDVLCCEINGIPAGGPREQPTTHSIDDAINNLIIEVLYGKREGECGIEYQQLINWLRELQELKK